MAVKVIDNQTVVMYSDMDFNERNHKCTWDYRDYCQVVRTDQTTMFQVLLTPETEENLIPNGDFDDNDAYLANWNITGGTAQPYNGMAVIRSFSVPFGGISQTVNVSQNSYYYIEFTVSDITANSQLVVTFKPVPDYDNTAALAITEPGTYYFFFQSGLSTSVIIDLTLTGALRPQVNIEYIQMWKMSYPTITVEGCTDGVVYRTVTADAVEEDRANYAIDWYGLDYGCYRICVTGIDDLTYNYLEFALALGTEYGAPLMMEDGGFVNWFG